MSPEPTRPHPGPDGNEPITIPRHVLRDLLPPYGGPGLLHQEWIYWRVSSMARAALDDPQGVAPEVRAAILAPILALHVPRIDPASGIERCSECHGFWPCATARAAGVTARPTQRGDQSSSPEQEA